MDLSASTADGGISVNEDVNAIRHPAKKNCHCCGDRLNLMVQAFFTLNSKQVYLAKAIMCFPKSKMTIKCDEFKCGWNY